MHFHDCSLRFDCSNYTEFFIVLCFGYRVSGRIESLSARGLQLDFVFIAMALFEALEKLKF